MFWYPGLPLCVSAWALFYPEQFQTCWCVCMHVCVQMTGHGHERSVVLTHLCCPELATWCVISTWTSVWESEIRKSHSRQFSSSARWRKKGIHLLSSKEDRYLPMLDKSSVVVPDWSSFFWEVCTWQSSTKCNLAAEEFNLGRLWLIAGGWVCSNFLLNPFAFLCHVGSILHSWGQIFLFCCTPLYSGGK